MSEITGSIVIDLPVEEVFDFLSDERNEPLFNPQMLSVEKLTPGPAGKGTKYRIQMKSGNRTLPMSLEFTTFERTARLGSHSSLSGVTIDGDLTFEAVDSRTMMRWRWRITPTGAMRLLTPLVVWMGRRQEERIWSDLKKYLESHRESLNQEDSNR